MPDPTKPRAVADDPSGIVQQMPEGLIAWPCNWQYQRVTLAGGRTQDETVYIRADIARATEADLRAEVERLTKRVAEWRSEYHAAQKGLDLYRRKNVELVAKNERLRAALRNIAHTFTENSHGDMKTLPAHQYQAMARIALSPKTDGGQDAPADS